MTGGEPGWVRRHVAWLLVTLAYVVVFPYFPRLNNPNENVRVWATRAVVAHGTFAIDQVEREWGEVSDRAAHAGHRYSGKAPGTSLLGVPVLAAQTALWRAAGQGPPSKTATIWALRVLTVAVPLSLFLLAFGRAVERETGSPWARDLLTVGLGLGTLLYPYGLLFVGHAQSAAAAFGGFLCVREAGRRERPARWLATGGLLAGAAVVFEYQALLAAVVVAVFAVVAQRRRALAFVAGAAIPALALGAYHTALFGSPWRTPLAYVDDPIFRMYHEQGFLGFSRLRPGVLASALFSADYGLFVFSPLLAAGLGSACAALRWGPRREAAVVVAVTGAMLLFLCGMSNWRGGWCAGGPRYVAAVAPFLTWGVALAWRRFWGARRAAGVALAGLALASVALCGIAGATFPHYPVQFDNPVFDVSLRLLGEGYAPRGLGTALGLPGALALAPWVLVAAGASALALGVRRRRAADVLASVAVASALVGALALVGRRPRYDETHAFGVVESVAMERGDGAP